MDEPNYVQRAVNIVAEELAAIGSTAGPEFHSGYAMLALTKGLDTTAQDVHDVWAVIRSGSRPDHPDIVPFWALPPATQRYDERYVKVIHRAAARIAVPEVTALDASR